MAFISPETGTELTTSNAEEEPSQELTRWTRIIRFFSSGMLRLSQQNAQGVPSGPAIGLKMDRSNIIAHGDVSVDVTVNNYAGCSDSRQNQPTGGGHSMDPQTSQVIGRPRFLDGLPQFSMWDVRTEERLGDTGFCRVYAAKVKGERALVKEFYGPNATKDWVTTARFHAATHFMPEFLRLVGTSGTQEGTEDGDEFRARPFLLLECGTRWDVYEMAIRLNDTTFLDDLLPWEPNKIFGGFTDLSTFNGLLRGISLIKNISNIMVYLTDVSMLDSATTPHIEVYQRPPKPNIRGRPNVQPVVAFNYPGSPAPACRFIDLVALLKTAIFGGPTGIEYMLSDPHGRGMSISIYDHLINHTLVKTLQNKHGLA